MLRDPKLPPSVAESAKSYLKTNVITMFSKQVLAKNDSGYDREKENVGSKATKNDSEKTRNPRRGRRASTQMLLLTRVDWGGII